MSDRVFFRTLLRTGVRCCQHALDGIRRGMTGDRRFLQVTWQLVVRYERLEVDHRTARTFVGGDAVLYQRFRLAVNRGLADPSVRRALVLQLLRRIRQLRRDLQLASDFEFFCGGGMGLRDEIELVRMFLEPRFPSIPGREAYTDALARTDAVLRDRLASFLERDAPMRHAGPEDGFGLRVGVLPRRFWWRFLEVPKLVEG